MADNWSMSWISAGCNRRNILQDRLLVLRLLVLTTGIIVAIIDQIFP
jgi:hypothetical protein